MSIFRRNTDIRKYVLPAAPITGPIRVVSQIGQKDGMFVKGREDHYFSVGRSALEAVRLAMLAAHKESLHNILDLPCGYGRVLRALKAAFPEARFTACDLLRKGVDFCVQTFGAIGDYSDPDPGKIALEGPYDFIWSGSLLTHLNQTEYLKFLNLFSRLLAPGGLLVATTHGRSVADRLRNGGPHYQLPAAALPAMVAQYDETGFGYSDYPNQSCYGISVNSPEWLMRQISKMPEMRVVMFSEKFWDNHQDVIACVKV